MISGFSFKILFLDDDGNCLDTTHTDIQVTATEDQEEDRYGAELIAPAFAVLISSSQGVYTHKHSSRRDRIHVCLAG
jgi:hypothetical protein